jgi:hypothetical protein
MSFRHLQTLIQYCQWEDLFQWLHQQQKLNLINPPEEEEQLPPGLFFQACERRAPIRILQSMLDLNPSLAMYRGHHNNFALHLLLTYRSDNYDAATQEEYVLFLEALIRANPEALQEVNNDGYSPGDLVEEQRIRDLQLNTRNKVATAVGEKTFSTSNLRILVQRPSACWHQCQKDEQREKNHVSRLQRIQEQVDSALETLSSHQERMNNRWERVQLMKEQVDALELPDYTNLGQTMDNEWSDSLRKDQLSADRRLQRIEEEIRSASIREYIAMAASQVHQNDVLRIQAKTSQTANEMLERIRKVKTLALEQSSQGMAMNSIEDN